MSRAAAQDRAARLLESVHIPDPTRRLSAYPHQLSGGMRQRVMIAMALSCNPRLLIADEPTTALDVTVQAQIVELLRELRDTTDLAVLFVTHDLALISEFSDEIAVMYAGQMVERAATADMFARPLHPYTAALLAAQPGVRETLDQPSLIAGQVPQAGQFPSGCRFNPRCDYAEDACRSGELELIVVGGDRQCRCRRSEELTLPGVRTAPIRVELGAAPGEVDVSTSLARRSRAGDRGRRPGRRAGRRVLRFHGPPPRRRQGNGACGRPRGSRRSLEARHLALSGRVVRASPPWLG